MQQPKLKRWNLFFLSELSPWIISVVARRKSERKLLDLAPFLASWITVLRMQGLHPYCWTKPPGLFLAAVREWATSTQGITLSLPRAEWLQANSQLGMVSGLASSQTTPVDCDVRMCWRLARNSSNKLTIQMIKFQGPGMFLGTVTDIPQ